MSKTTLPRLMSLKQVAEQTGFSVASLRREVRAGRLPCYRCRPGSTAKIMLKPADVLAWLEDHCQRQRALRPGA